MGWFNDQIQDRKIKDDEALENAFANVVSAVLGKRAGASDEREIVQDAVEDILKYFHLTAGEIPDNVTKKEEQLEYLLRPHGIMTRRVELTEGWYKDCAGPLLGVNAADGEAAAHNKPHAQHQNRRLRQGVHYRRDHAEHIVQL